MKLSEKLIKLRKARGLSQEEFGNEINVSRQAISKWELDQTKPDIEKLKNIAEYYDVSYDYLLDDNLDDENNTCDNICELSKNKKIIKSKGIKILVGIILLYLIFCMYKFVVVMRFYAIANSFSEKNYQLYLGSDNYSPTMENTKFRTLFIRKDDVLIEKIYSYNGTYDSLLKDYNGVELPWSINYSDFEKHIFYTLNWNYELNKYEYVDNSENIPIEDVDIGENQNLVKECTLSFFSVYNILDYTFNPFVYYVSPLDRSIIKYSISGMSTSKLTLNTDYVIDEFLITTKDGQIIKTQYSYDYVQEHFENRIIENPLEEYEIIY